MFFKRKTRNRRLNSGTVLDVKLRSDQVRATRSRALAVSLGVAFATFFCLFLVWRTGEFILRKLVYENTSFAIAEVDAKTDGVIAADQIKRWASVKIGQNLMALDLVRVKRDLELVPFVQSVTVERVLPRTLRIRVTERQPVAQVRLVHPRPTGGYDTNVVHLDVDGFAMAPIDPRIRNTPPTPADLALPLVTGVNPMDVKAIGQTDSEQVRGALELIGKYYQCPMAGITDLKCVDVSSPEILIVTTGQGSEITFGVRDIDQQLLRWREIYEQGLRYNKSIRSLDLAVKNNIPARWMEASVQPRPVIPKPAKPARVTTTRRRV
jgi:cell division septal protein FtsQ